MKTFIKNFTKRFFWKSSEEPTQPTPQCSPKSSDVPPSVSVEESAPAAVKKKRNYTKRKAKTAGDGSAKPAE